MVYFRAPQTYRPQRMHAGSDRVVAARQTRRAIEAEEDAQRYPFFYPQPNLSSDRRGRGAYTAFALTAALMLTTALAGCIDGYGNGSGTAGSKSYDNGPDGTSHTADDSFKVNVSDIDGRYSFVITEKTLYKGKPIGSPENLSKIFNQTGKGGMIGIKFDKDKVDRERQVYDASEITSWRSEEEMNRERAASLHTLAAMFAALIPLGTSPIWVPPLASRISRRLRRNK